MKHTPGPWFLKTFEEPFPTRRQKTFTHIVSDRSGQTDIFTVKDIGKECPEALPNARLIAAAPEMLDGIKRTLNFLMLNDLLPKHQDLADELNAIVAKAEGRSE